MLRVWKIMLDSDAELVFVMPWLEFLQSQREGAKHFAPSRVISRYFLLRDYRLLLDEHSIIAITQNKTSTR
jgi:hypothetical protein